MVIVKKMIAFWDIVPCSHVVIDRCFSNDIALMMEALCTYETSAYYEVYTAQYHGRLSIIFILATMRT
jgi:hypothetical protein